MSDKLTIWLNEPNTQTEQHIEQVLTRANALCQVNGWSEGYFSKMAAGDDTVIKRMRESGRVTAAIIARVERFLDEKEAA